MLFSRGTSLQGVSGWKSDSQTKVMENRQTSGITGRKIFTDGHKKTSLGGGSRVQEVLAALGENPLVADKNGGGYFLIVD
ncbi:MAG: hypothetical protein ACXVBR_07800 [Flavisolibacter sp.]